jgi:hypothetical protein
MSKILYYYESEDQPLKRNIPVYLSREGFDLYHISNVSEIDKALEEFKPKAILVHNESDAVLLSRASKLPIVIVMEAPVNMYEVNQLLKDVLNPIFVRYANDSLDTILNTAKLATTL